MTTTTNRWQARAAAVVVVLCITATALLEAWPRAGGPGTGQQAAYQLVVAAQQPAPPAARDEFVPLSELPPQEQLPAAPLLVAAYGLLWVMLLVYLVMLWRRLTRVEKELAGVARQVEEKRRG